MPLSAESLYVKYSSDQQGLSLSATPLSVDMHDDLMNISNVVSGVITAKYVGRVSATVSNQLTRAVGKQADNVISEDRGSSKHSLQQISSLR